MQPHLLSGTVNCKKFWEYVTNTYIPKIKEFFYSSIPKKIDENKDFNKDLQFLNDEEFFYDGIVTINAKLSTATGKKVKIYSTLGFEIEPGAEISPDIELIVGWPLEVYPQPPQTNEQIRNFCANNNKYKAQYFSQTSIKQFEEEQRLPRAIRDKSAGILSMRIYPNPTQTVFTLNVFNHQWHPYIVSITDLTGRILESKSFDGEQATQRFDVSQYASGIYFVNLSCNGESKTQKIVIQND